MVPVAWGKNTVEVRIFALVFVGNVIIEYLSRLLINFYAPGVHTWADGRVYNGNYDGGREHGFGTLTFPDGTKYRGQFRKGTKHGYGIQLWKTRTYDGEWYDLLLHGWKLGFRRCLSHGESIFV